MVVDLPRRLLAEAAGTGLLLAVVIGSGIMAERLSGGNVAIALLANTLADIPVFSDTPRGKAVGIPVKAGGCC